MIKFDVSFKTKKHSEFGPMLCDVCKEYRSGSDYLEILVAAKKKTVLLCPVCSSYVLKKRDELRAKRNSDVSTTDT